MLSEFREFIARGNVFDMAVGIVIGAAFTSVVDSFVKDILMPPIGVVSGGVDFTDLFVNLGPGDYRSLAEATAAGAPTLNYGLFINALISFLIVAFAVFMLVRSYNRLRREKESIAAEPTDKECPFCRFEIPLAATRCPHCTSELAEAA
ncbi:large-conductance mechanosensitive channel protein MscL [soil metagenome]